MIAGITAMQVPTRLTSMPFVSGPPPWRQMQAKTDNPPVQPLQQPAITKPAEAKSFGFADFIDAINPLQHIPIISTLYRKLTGDEIGAGAQLAGDALYGGLFGTLVTSLVSSVVNFFVRETTGSDIGDHLFAASEPAKPEPAMAVKPAQPEPAAEPVSIRANWAGNEQASVFSGQNAAAGQTYGAMCMAESDASGSNHYWA